MVCISAMRRAVFSGRRAKWLNSPGEQEISHRKEKSVKTSTQIRPPRRRRGKEKSERVSMQTLIAHHTKIIERNPNDLDAYQSRRAAYFEQGDYACVISDCNKIIERDPENIVAYQYRGMAYFEQLEQGDAFCALSN